MIPVLAVPVLRPDLVAGMLASVDVPVGIVIVIDNGGAADVPGAHVVHLPANLGVAASWNLAMRLTPRAPWWAIVNDDVTFSPGDLAALAHAMADPEPRLVTLCGFSAFGINRGALRAVGWFDESYHPAYVEDCDYEYRCKLAGVPIVPLARDTRHRNSSTIEIPRWGRANERTQPANIAYHIAKWGGAPRGGEVWAVPFNGARALYPDPDRLADLAWNEAAETTMILPDGETR